MTYELNSRNRHQSKLLKFLAGAVLVGGLTGYGLSSVHRIEDEAKLISSYTSTETQPVARGDTYWDYAKNLKEQYPQLQGLNVNDLAREIQKINGNKPLNYSGSAKIPVYDFPKPEGD